MSAESPRHARSGGPLTVPSQPPTDRSIIDAVSGFINDVTLSSSSTQDPKDVIQWARFETADINEPTPEGDGDNDISPLLLILGYGAGVQVWLVPPSGEAQEVLSWRQGTVRVLRILPTPQHGDCYVSKRPLIALCDSSSPGPSFCSLSFISIRGGEQVKSIKFKNPILDVLANKRSVVVSFSERFAVFDAGTLEDRMAVTSCYPCPCPLGGSAPINPLALGDRWLAYADKKLNQSKRSSGGCEGEGQTSYTATVLHAAKSLSKGLRGLGESVAHSLAGGRSTSQSPSPPNADAPQPGVITILDIEGNEEEDGQSEEAYDPIVAHFIAHSEAIIALKFDASGMLLVTADRRGHDFHVFRINPHPCGGGLASVHHLYVLHRGDTTAKVQDIALSPDSRWAAVSTLRGTTHIFALSPYGGACGVRTHTAPRVVNRLSRFHRSAGLPIHAQHHTGSPVSEGIGAWFPNPRLPPYPSPTVSAPLAQLRPTANLPTHTITRTSSGRQRLSSLSEDSNTAPLLARARFGPTTVTSSTGVKTPAASLYLMSASGCLSHIALHVRPARNVPKEKICDESPIELEVEPIAQWPLQRPAAAADLLAPLPPSNPLLQPMTCRRCADMCMSEEERWLSQVEIVTHAGPHRRLWMGPQFVFKTYNCTGSNSSLSEAETVEIDTNVSGGVARSTPVNMPAARPIVPVLIDSGSASSLEHSPSDSFRRKSLLAESGRAASVCDVQLKEDLAEAMKEDHGWCLERVTPRAGTVARHVDPSGTVVAETPELTRTQPDDPDDHTTCNQDEATFRPVVRAPATLIQPDMLIKPLPRTTTIPVQTITAPDPIPSPDPLPLTTHVVIPAALTSVAPCHASDGLVDQESPTGESILDFTKETEDCRKEDEPCKGIKVESGRKETKEPEVRERKNTRDKSPKVPEVKKEELEVRERKNTRDKSPKSSTNNEKRGLNDKLVTQETKPEKSIETKDVSKNDTKIEKSVEKKDVSKTEKSKRKESPAKVEKVDKVATKTDKLAAKTDDTKMKIEEVEPRPTEVASKIDSVNVDDKRADVNKDLKQEIDARKRERSSAECAERKRDDSKPLPKSNRQPDDIQPAASVRVKKSPTPQSVSDRISESSFKDYKSKNIEDIIEPKDEVKEFKEIKKQIRDSRGSKDKEIKAAIVKDDRRVDEFKNKTDLSDSCKLDKKELIVDDPPATLKVSTTNKKETTPIKQKKQEDDIKTEEQAWDMLLNEPDKQITFNLSQTEEKPKAKKNRKLKKTQDEQQSKTDDDSFVEIHAIEEKQPTDLVSISTPLEDIDSTSSYLSKTKKRASKSLTPEKMDDTKSFETILQSEPETVTIKTKSNKKFEDKSDIEVLPSPTQVQIEINKETFSSKSKKHSEASTSEIFLQKETPKPNKSKSLSPYPEPRKEKADVEKDVYVINTVGEEFPEIQITRGAKPRKRSPQLIERKTEPVIEKPVKSWSSIAAAKTKKPDDIEKVEADKKGNKYDDDNQMSSTTVSLQEKLFELCKRTDIMVAECDAPTQLNFVEEHHGDLDLPPLEPLDFGLDDFRLEVMRDSLLDVNDTKLTSPICKINIDDILSSIKETTTKAIECSAFNLIDLEKVPAKKEKGFSMIEEHKILSQEVQLDDVCKEEKEGDMEKSSEDDTSPVISTDSDKEDKKIAGASNVVLPSSKQSAKNKKSRRKKK